MLTAVQEKEVLQVEIEVQGEVKELSPVELAWVGGGTGSFDTVL